MDDREGTADTVCSREQQSERAVRYHQAAEQQIVAVTNKERKILKRKEVRQARWKRHFQKVLDREAPPNPTTDEKI